MTHLRLSRARLALPALLALLLVACAGGTDGGTGAGPGTGRTATVANGTVEVTADNLAFDVSTIQAPAGEPFTISFTNAEAEPHNIAVYTEQGGELIVRGDIISGPDATAEYQVPALEPGEYFFDCSVHPEMTGTIVVEG